MAGRYALIVATDTYEDQKLSRLRTPAQDAEALARVLSDPGIGDFEVRLLNNQPESVLRRGIAAFFSDRSRDELLLLHFSCHGLKDDSGQLYFAATDTEVAHLDASAVPAEFVSRQMARSRSNSVLMLLDCCYSGAIARGLTFRAGDDVNVNEHLGGHGRAIITASSAMEYAFEGDALTGEGRPSVFTSAVVKALETGEADRDQDRWISVRELYDYVCDEVREITPNQRPNLLSHLEGELYVARSRYVAPVAPAQLPGDLLEALDNQLAPVRIGAVSALAELLSSSDPALAEAARRRLERLAAEDDSRRVTNAAAAALGRPEAETPDQAAPPPPLAPASPDTHWWIPAAAPETPTPEPPLAAAAEMPAGASPPEILAPPAAAVAETPASPAPPSLARWRATVLRRDAWPLGVTLLAALVLLNAWSTRWTYDSKVPDLINELDRPADGVLTGLLAPAALALPLLVLAVLGRVPRSGWWALLLMAGWDLGVIAVLVDRMWSNEWHAGAPMAIVALLALVIAAAVMIVRRPPARAPAPAWLGDALAIAGALVVASTLSSANPGYEERNYLRQDLSWLCLASALIAVARRFRVPIVSSRAAAAGLAAVGAAAAGLGVALVQWGIILPAVVFAAGAVYSGATR